MSGEGPFAADEPAGQTEVPSTDDAEVGLEYSLASLRDVIFSVLDLVAARSVVEVGAAEGSFTAELLRWGAENGARITAIDNAPTPELRALAARRPELALVEAMSVDALPAVGPSDVFVIDGDHNYFTVTEELRLIARLGHPRWSFPLVLLHDVSWPWGRRDCYYNLDALPEDGRLPSIPGEEFGPWGRVTLGNSGIFVATREGGPKNGVLTAAEDFAMAREDLRLVVVPAFHGLGILYPMGPDWSGQLEALVKAWDRNPLLTRLEKDRIDKINTVAQLVLSHRETWEEGVRHAHELERGWRESIDRVLEMEKELADARQGILERDRQFVESAEHMTKLEAGWKEAAARFETVQRTMHMYELALFRHERDWRQTVRGPEFTGEDGRDVARPERYQQWMASRPEPPAPHEGPTFSILTPVFNPDSRFLESCIRSVRGQTYRRWQLVLANVSAAPHVRPICRRFSLVDDRVTVITGENEGIAENTNFAADHAAGDWLVFLDHDDELAPHALAALAAVIEGDPSVDFIYSDEDKLTLTGERVDPLFKPDWSPDLLRMVNYIGHLVAVRRTLFDAVGRMRAGYDGAQDFDFLLRATRSAQRVAHIPDILYHWRRHENSTAVDVRVKPEAHGAGRCALQDFADAEAPGAWVDLGAGPTTHRLRYPLRTEKVGIIVPFRDAPEVTDACLSSLARHFNALPYEVLLVSNRSREEKTFALMEEWERRYRWARCLEYDHPFNFQALNNWAVTKSEGELLLFLNNDVEALHDGWIDGLAELAQRRDVGAVGPRLFYPDGLVQHAGVVVGIGGFAEHPWSGQHPDRWTVAGPSYWVRNFLALTAACLMIGRPKFEELCGFDERFEVCGGDVDLGLRLHAAGYWNVMTPFVRLVHHESMTRDRVPPQGDIEHSLRSYRPYLEGGDPFYNANLTLNDTSCEVTVPGTPPGAGVG